MYKTLKNSRNLAIFLLIGLTLLALGIYAFQSKLDSDQTINQVRELQKEIVTKTNDLYYNHTLI